MNNALFTNIDLIAEIEELEAKIAPSGAATLGDLQIETFMRNSEMKTNNAGVWI